MTVDLIHSSEIKQMVREVYAAYQPPAGGPVACKNYAPEDLERVPRLAAEFALGVADHVRYADIRPGDTVLDIGCGAGIDSVLAARRAGPSGRVVALDFLPEMLERTARSAAEAGLDNIETLEGEMEAIPLPDESVDVVISNGAINLSPRKSRVMLECARVLRPAGRFCVSDLTIAEEDLPSEILSHPAAWAG